MFATRSFCGVRGLALAVLLRGLPRLGRAAPLAGCASDFRLLTGETKRAASRAANSGSKQPHSTEGRCFLPANGCADGFGPGAFVAARGYPAQHVMRLLAALTACVFRHVRGGGV